MEIVISTAARRHQASSEAESISRITRRLQPQFPELEAETIEAVVNKRYHLFDGQPIRDFIPILVEYAAREDPNGPSSFDSMTHAARRSR